MLLLISATCLCHLCHFVNQYSHLFDNFSSMEYLIIVKSLLLTENKVICAIWWLSLIESGSMNTVSRDESGRCLKWTVWVIRINRAERYLIVFCAKVEDNDSKWMVWKYESDSLEDSFWTVQFNI